MVAREERKKDRDEEYVRVNGEATPTAVDESETKAGNHIQSEDLAKKAEDPQPEPEPWNIVDSGAEADDEWETESEKWVEAKGLDQE